MIMSSTNARAPWRCDVVGTFAHRTCTVRWPAIVRGVAVDVTEAAPALRALADEIENGRVVGLTTSTKEHARWGVVDDFVGQPWTSLPWYVGEAFLYARIREAVRYDDTGRDPFLAAKLREERELLVIDDVGDAGDAGDASDAGDDGLVRALWRALWGNRGDLSLPEARAHQGADAADLVVDDRDAALAALRAARRVALVLDNAGPELAADLALARVLRRRGVAVTLLPKDAPFFVSDALVADIDRLVAAGHDHGGADVVVQPFFTGPSFLCSAELPSALGKLFGGVDVVVAKGDCNYRRLVGDVPYDVDDTRGFDDVVDLPATVIALRTLKAEVLVGAAVDRARTARERDGAWLVGGRFGVVQVARAGGRNLR
jgi:uncharacterized protein with ATP-grasp and redox domains